MTTITGFTSHDVRFPTSLDQVGSDGMNRGPDYSAAYCILQTDSEHNGYGMTFTIGRGNDLICSAIDLLAPLIVNRKLEELVQNWAQTWRYLTSDSQLRWVGPEKGVVHMALGAVVNAIWDLWGRSEGKPVWKLIADMSPEQVVQCIDFRYLTDAITPEEAIQMLYETQQGKTERMEEVESNRAVPAYTTSAGWLGFSKDRMRELLQQNLDQGFKHFKLKVGGSVEEDRERLQLAREVIGYDQGNVLMVDANQVWSVPEAIDYMKCLAEFQPWFIEEPTSPDDILGHATIRKALQGKVGVATGEMVQNRILFKQLLQAGAIDVLQPDACRVGGVNEVLAILLLARKFKVPIVPHSGGVGLPEYTAHLSTIDFLVVSGQKSILEYVDHLHEHFLEPARTEAGYYVTPQAPGYSVQMKPETLERYSFPGGPKAGGEALKQMVFFREIAD
ncbi:enolase C-terminal domain-like protein [Penicillium macrosclerotiorum]|uniref:enolase C-terminal domain-like protein n=1 Tax=Penicillium macrosclerotiorum TaxID=303699 RepID=UPI002546E73C|nr:enolase C-terminal domain-like protein [Penicillium macrosclerotiorum]KAJ5698572.1 enolase C-terminal domain-like protein [Penicillium macrosclerotiorum]